MMLYPAVVLEGSASRGATLRRVLVSFKFAFLAGAPPYLGEVTCGSVPEFPGLIELNTGFRTPAAPAHEIVIVVACRANRKLKGRGTIW